MAYETILEPINGEEARKVLKSMMIERIDKIPMLKVGNAFKQLKLGFELIFEAYPKDCPVPIAEWQLLMGLKEGDDIEFDKDVKKLEILKEKRAEVAENLDRIDSFLEKYAPTEIITDIESDDGVPDELRVRHGLKVPMLHTSPTGKKNEVMVDPKQLVK